MRTLRVETIDAKLKDEVMAEPGGGNLLRCFACGTCMATCLVSRVNPDYNPRRALRMVMMGMREEVFTNPTIWMCSACDACYPRCPQNIHISDVMKAIKAVAIRDGYSAPGPVAEVNEDECAGCSMCVMACPYDALSLVDKPVNGQEDRVSQVDVNECMNCGVCASTCPLGAITVEDYANEDVVVRMQEGGWLTDRKTASNGEPRLLVFNCNWCLRAEADRQALATMPDNVRVITIPCSGRMDPEFILLALSQGVDGVLVVGCEPGECHYQLGNYLAQGKMHLFDVALQQMGIDNRNVRFTQVGTDERGRLPALINNMLEDLKARMTEKAAG